MVQELLVFLHHGLCCDLVPLAEMESHGIEGWHLAESCNLRVLLHNSFRSIDSHCGSSTKNEYINEARL